MRALEWLARGLAFVVFYIVGVGFVMWLLVFPPGMATLYVAERLPYTISHNLVMGLVVFLPLLGVFFMAWVALLQWTLGRCSTPRFVERSLFWLFDLDEEEAAP